MFQTMMNSLFKKLIDRGVVVIYIDDIMISTKTLEEHWRVVKEVLQILRDEHLYLSHDKCDFEVQKTEFLGLIVAQDQVKMDHKKVSAIKDWPVPTSKKQLQGFLGFLNFYWHFVQNFTQIAWPLNALTLVTKEFKWTKECQEAFQKLKKTITSAPSLAMPTDTDLYRVKTDGSGIGVSAILSQKHNRIWHPIAFISWFLNDAKRNYHAADLEMLAIIFALTEWRHYLLDVSHPVEILMDHKNLKFFRKPQDLSCHQARWQQILQEYHLVISYCSRKTNPANPLSRRPDFEKGVELNNKSQILLPNTLFSPPSSLISISAVASTSITLRITSLQYKLEWFAKEGLNKKDSHWTKQDRLVKWKNLIYISNDTKLREDVIIANHDHPIAEHPSIKRTHDLIMSKYYWPTLKKDIEAYVKGCDTCQKVKAKNSSTTTPLHPNEIPSSPWEIISIDLIGPLPQSEGKNAILVIVDQFSKIIHLFPVMDTITSKGIATIFHDLIFKLHGTP